VHIVFSADNTQRPAISERTRLQHENCAAIATPDLANFVLGIVYGEAATSNSAEQSCRFRRKFSLADLTDNITALLPNVKARSSGT